MSNEQQAKAKQLYFQTDLSKTQISELVDVPRRTLHYWIKEQNWDRLKRSAAHMPSLLAENCYHLIGRFSRQLLSEDRIMRPVTHKEADTLHKLVISANKLKNRSTLNESMEMLGFFMDRVSRKSPELAKEIMPFVDDYINDRGNVYISDFYPQEFNEMGLIPKPDDNEEVKLDLQDIFEWTETGTILDIEQFRCMDEQPAPQPAETSTATITETPTETPQAKETETPPINTTPKQSTIKTKKTNTVSPEQLAHMREQLKGLKRYDQLSRKHENTPASPPENIRHQTMATA